MTDGRAEASQSAGTADTADTVEQWPVLSSVTHFGGKVIGVRTDQVLMPDGNTAEREVVEHPGAAAIVALDEHDRVLLIRQYRHPVGGLLWELPAGLRDKPDEPVIVTAERELLEETGYRAGDWRVLVDFFSSPGVSSERVRVFLARDLFEVPHAERDYVPKHEEAYLRLAWLPLDQAVALILSGDMHNVAAEVGILSAYAARRDGFAGLSPSGRARSLTGGRRARPD